MKKAFKLFVVVILVSTAIVLLFIGRYSLIKKGPSQTQNAHLLCGSGRNMYACGELLVTFNTSLSENDISDFVKSLGLTSEKHAGFYLINVEPGKELEWRSKLLEYTTQLKSVELNSVATIN